MWYDFLHILVELGLLREDYLAARQVRRMNKENAKKGVQKVYVLYPSVRIIAVAMLLLFGIAMAYVFFGSPGTRKAQGVEEMTEIKDALLKYKNELGRYPIEFAELVEGRPLRKAWIKDRWGLPYLYRVTEDGKNFILISAGSDGKINTEDDLVISSK